MTIEIDTCAFLPCDQVESCALAGGCVQRRFPRVVARTEEPEIPESAATQQTKRRRRATPREEGR